MQGVQRYVMFVYLAAGLILWATFGRLLSGIFYAASLPDAPLLGSNFTLTSMLALVLGGGIAFVAYRNPRAHDFLSEVVAELKKVTWPSKKETQTATVVVIITSLILAVLMGLFDQLWGNLTSVIYK